VIDIIELHDLSEAKDIVLDRWESSRLHKYGVSPNFKGFIRLLFNITKHSDRSLFMVVEDGVQVGLLGMELVFLPHAPGLRLGRECHFYLSDKCSNSALAVRKMFNTIDAWVEERDCTHKMFQVDYAHGTGEEKSERMCKHLEKTGWKLEAQNYLKEI